MTKSLIRSILLEITKAGTLLTVFLLASSLLGITIAISYNILPSPTLGMKYIGAISSLGTFLMMAWMLGDLQHRWYCLRTL